MTRTLFCFLLILAGSSYRPAHAQTTLTANQAYEYLQGERRRADRVLGSTDQPPTDSLRKAEQVLLDALTYYHRPETQTLAKDNVYLAARKGDISYDLAIVQAKLGQHDTAAQPRKPWFMC